MLNKEVGFMHTAGQRGGFSYSIGAVSIGEWFVDCQPKGRKLWCPLCILSAFVIAVCGVSPNQGFAIPLSMRLWS